jgi:hypothetical protein
MTIPEERLKHAMDCADGVMTVEGFEKSAGMKAIDEALLNRRCSLEEARTFLLLHAHVLSAQAVLQHLGNDDPRFEVISQRCQKQTQQLRLMAIEMDGAVRVAFGL